MIYMDPPYGVKFGSNFQPFVRKRDVKHNDDADLTREPEMVQAYRDTWELGLHSYLTYLRDRLLVARDLLTPSGSVFVQISDENLHHVRGVMDEVLGADNFVAIVTFKKTSGAGSPSGGTDVVPSVTDFLIWYGKDRQYTKYNAQYVSKAGGEDLGAYVWIQLTDGTRRKMTSEERTNRDLLPDDAKIFRADNLTSQSGVDKYCAQPGATIPAHALFPQLVPVVERYLSERVEVLHGGDLKDAFLSPYFGWLIEVLREHIRPDLAQGEAPEIPRYEENRVEGSTADVDTWTSKEVREVTRSHVNFVIADTQQWEQAAAFILDTHPRVKAFAKNAGLGFGIPYLHNGQMHDYVPDFLVRLHDVPEATIILETKGFDLLAEVKASAAARWVNAVNADGSHGQWRYELARSVSSVGEKLNAIA